MRLGILGDLAMFATIAEERSFTRAARRLGLTQSALSQTLKRLEAELGVKLLARTTRSVSPTDAGAQLLATVGPAFDDVAAGIEMLARLRDEPTGTIRVTAGKHAADTILWPALVPFMRDHPGIRVEVTVDNGFVDIVAGRFDAGIRLGEHLAQDMVALPVGPPQRVAVAAAPAYLARHGTPRRPADLVHHRGIGFGDANGDVAAWAFERDGDALTVRPERGLVLNDADLMIAAAREGFGILYILEELARPSIAEGSLVRLLDDWCPPFAGYHLYYPGRRQHTKAFTLFRDALRPPVLPTG